jgi:hypothetical protein
VGGGIYQPDMAERLREVAQQMSTARVDLLGEQAEIVAGSDHPLKERLGLGDLPGAGPRVRRVLLRKTVPFFPGRTQSFAGATTNVVKLTEERA